MAKTETASTEPAATESQAAPAVADEFALPLQEFCTRLSGADKRVELIGGFEHSERTAGRAKDTETAYLGRFVAFTNRPA